MLLRCIILISLPCSLPYVSFANPLSPVFTIKDGRAPFAAFLAEDSYSDLFLKNENNVASSVFFPLTLRYDLPQRNNLVKQEGDLLGIYTQVDKSVVPLYLDKDNIVKGDNGSTEQFKIPVYYITTKKMLGKKLKYRISSNPGYQAYEDSHRFIDDSRIEILNNNHTLFCSDGGKPCYQGNGSKLDIGFVRNLVTGKRSLLVYDDVDLLKNIRTQICFISQTKNLSVEIQVSSSPGGQHYKVQSKDFGSSTHMFHCFKDPYNLNYISLRSGKDENGKTYKIFVANNSDRNKLDDLSHYKMIDLNRVSSSNEKVDTSLTHKVSSVNLYNERTKTNEFAARLISKIPPEYKLVLPSLPQNIDERLIIEILDDDGSLTEKNSKKNEISINWKSKNEKLFNIAGIRSGSSKSTKIVGGKFEANSYSRVIFELKEPKKNIIEKVETKSKYKLSENKSKVTITISKAGSQLDVGISLKKKKANTLKIIMGEGSEKIILYKSNSFNPNKLNNVINNSINLDKYYYLFLLSSDGHKFSKIIINGKPISIGKSGDYYRIPIKKYKSDITIDIKKLPKINKYNILLKVFRDEHGIANQEITKYFNFSGAKIEKLSSGYYKLWLEENKNFKLSPLDNTNIISVKINGNSIPIEEMVFKQSKLDTKKFNELKVTLKSLKIHLPRRFTIKPYFRFSEKSPDSLQLTGCKVVLIIKEKPYIGKFENGETTFDLSDSVIALNNEDIISLQLSSSGDEAYCKNFSISTSASSFKNSLVKASNDIHLYYYNQNYKLFVVLFSPNKFIKYHGDAKEILNAIQAIYAKGIDKGVYVGAKLFIGDKLIETKNAFSRSLHLKDYLESTKFMRKNLKSYFHYEKLMLDKIKEKNSKKYTLSGNKIDFLLIQEDSDPQCEWSTPFTLSKDSSAIKIKLIKQVSLEDGKKLNYISDSIVSCKSNNFKWKDGAIKENISIQISKFEENDSLDKIMKDTISYSGQLFLESK